MAERWKWSAFVIYAFYMSMFVYPVFGNWVWGGGWLSDLGANFGLGHGHVDFAGSSVVHLTGGVISIVGARNHGLLFWENRMRAASDELIVTTDDGSYGRQGLVIGPEKEILEAGVPVQRIWAIGPAVMMMNACHTSRPFGVKTLVSLNSIMVDGTGMCGACRVEVGGITRFACVDGPEFDGHEVNWDLLMARQRIYLDEEKRALAHYEERCSSRR